MKGTVKLFKRQSNYGFIETDEMDDDVFFHVSELEGIDEDDVEEGLEVEFEVEEGDRGPAATGVSAAE